MAMSVEPAGVPFGNHCSSIDKIAKMEMMVIVVAHSKVGTGVINAILIHDATPAHVIHQFMGV